MKDKIYYFADFNLNALLFLSEQLRGRPCTCDVDEMPKCGSLNWLIFITFDDGMDWVFRSPMTHRNHFYSDETASKIVESEAATLMYLKAHTSIPVPEVHAYSGYNDNDVGVPYILQSKAAGRSLGSYNWSQQREQVIGSRKPHTLLSISDQDREKVMSQLGSIMGELSDHRFDEIGLLSHDENGGYVIGECLSPRLTWQERDSLDLDRGPFHQEQEYLVSLISAFTSHAQELPLTPHVLYAPAPHELHYKTVESYRAAAKRWNDFVSVGQKIGHSKNVLCYCIAGQFLLDMIPHLSSADLDSGFTLSHPDLHVGNVYVDDDFNITCIIDWSSTSTGPISELLATPALGGPEKPPAEYLTAAFRLGFSRQTSKVAPKLSPKLWKIPDCMWHFSRLVRLLSRNDYEHFRQLFELINWPNAEGAGIL